MIALLHGPLSLFIAQAVLIIALSRVIGLLARRIGQPMVVAEVVAGILLGPSLLGWASPHLSEALFPKTSMTLLNMLSQVGLMLFMFLIGLELDPRLLRGRGRASVAISNAGIAVPFALGTLLSFYLYPRVSGGEVRFLSFTLFLGVAMSITAFPVLARILVERRLLRSKVGALAITCAAVDDVTAWCLLAFVVSIVRAAGAGQGARTTLLAGGYVGFMLLVVRPFLRRFGARAANREGLTQNMVAVVFLLVFLSCWATELIGIHALFGAFVMGAAMPKEGGFAHALADKVEDLVVVFLLPLFFAYSGLRTQIGLLRSADSLALCGLIILCACAGKFGGSALAARLTGLTWREAGALGILMNTRGLMELVVLNIGLDLGVISPTLFTMMVVMALVTTFMTTPLLLWVYPRGELAKELAEAPEPAPLSRPEGAFSVLLCVSYERSGLGMVTLARALVGGAQGTSRVYALKLVRPSDRFSFYLDEQDQGGAAGLGHVLSRGEELGVQVRPLSFVSADPAADISNVAEVKGVDLVLLGWHKPLVSQSALGGTVYEVMDRAPADVGVLVDRGLREVRRVLVPYQGTVHDRAALALAHRLLHQAGASVTILHVVDPRRPRLGARERVDEVFREPGAAGAVQMKVVEDEDPAEAALREAAGGYDLVLVGVGREWGLSQRRFGVQPEHLIRRCPTSLLIVRQHGTAAP